MAKTKTPSRPPARPPAPRSQKTVERPRRVRRLIPIALVALAAVAVLAVVVAREQAGSGEAASPAATGLPNTPDYHSLLVDAENPDHLLLGTHAGLHETTDGGRTWAEAGLAGRDAMNLVRTDDGTVWAAGHEVLARSDDGGASWTDVEPEGLPGLDVHGFAAHPEDARVLYAAIAGEGLYRSDDGGRSFELVSREVGPGVMALAVAPDGRLLAGEMEQGLMASDDGGATWRPALAAGLLGLAVSQAHEGRMLATGPGILLSTDGGESWEEARAIPEGAGPVAWSPSEPDVAYAVGFDRRLYRSEDAGTTWTPID